jgi:hypothetical protein
VNGRGDTVVFPLSTEKKDKAGSKDDKDAKTAEEDSVS